VSIDTGPPAQPPQLSPDGNWVWDGSQWQPVTGDGAAPAHAGVFRAYDSIVVEPSAPTVEAAAPLGVQYEQQYPAPAPAIDYSYGGSQPDLTPLWQQSKGGGYGRYLYFGAAILLFVMVLIVLNSMSFVQLPFISTGSKSSPPQAIVTTSPTPDTSGPDSVRADRFLNGQLKPALVPFDDTLPAVVRGCVGNLSTACFDALTATDQQVNKLMTVIANGDIPSCISVPTTRLKADVKGMDDQIKSGLSGYTDNNKYTLQSATRGFWNNVDAATADISAAQQASKKCYTVVLPTWVPD
jgi:hypothetical protein